MSVELPDLSPDDIFGALARHNVDYVVIGGVAAILHGAPYNTGDIDICPSRKPDNLVRLASALTDLDARIYASELSEGLPFDRSAEMLERAGIWNLVTRAGRLDVSFLPSGTQGYDDLLRDVVHYDIHGLSVPTASLADVIRSKEAAGRPKDQWILHTLRQMLDHTDPPG